MLGTALILPFQWDFSNSLICRVYFVDPQIRTQNSSKTYCTKGVYAMEEYSIKRSSDGMVIMQYVDRYCDYTIIGKLKIPQHRCW